MAPRPPSINAAAAATTAALAIVGFSTAVLLLAKRWKSGDGSSSSSRSGDDYSSSSTTAEPHLGGGAVPVGTNDELSSSTPSACRRFDVPKELLAADCQYREEVKLAVRLALEAGANMIHHCEYKGTANAQSETDLGISTKTNETDFATAVDVTNEALIMDGIAQHFPNHKVIGEETVGTGTIPALTDHPTWICDPIDGTTNFASGLPLTCVSIGLCVGGEPVLGVCYAPVTRELYVAVRGCGAFRNGIQIRSTDPSASASEKNLSNGVVCFEFGYARSEESVDKMLGGVRRIMTHGCRATRSSGCGVLDLCYVATGRFDVVYTGLSEEGWKPWDYCAAMVVAEEAGCTIRSLMGRPGGEDVFDEFDINGGVVEGSKFDIYSSSMVCGVNRTIVEECRRVVLGL